MCMAQVTCTREVVLGREDPGQRAGRRTWGSPAAQAPSRRPITRTTPQATARTRQTRPAATGRRPAHTAATGARRPEATLSRPTQVLNLSMILKSGQVLDNFLIIIYA